MKNSSEAEKHIGVVAATSQEHNAESGEIGKTQVLLQKGEVPEDFLFGQ